MEDTSTQVDSKNPAVQWLAAGPATFEGLAMVTDNCRWQALLRAPMIVRSPAGKAKADYRWAAAVAAAHQ